MAKRSTNEAKREQFKAIMAQTFHNGWEVKHLAVLFGGTPSSFYSYANGKSMGTNALRAEIATLPVRMSEDAVKLMKEAVESYKSNASNYKVKWEEGQTEAAFNSNYLRVVEERNHNLEWHTKELAKAHTKAAMVRTNDPALRDYEKTYLDKTRDDNTQSDYEWDVQYHTENLTKAREATEATMKAEAKRRQDEYTKWNKRDYDKALKTLKNAEKVLADFLNHHSMPQE